MCAAVMDAEGMGRMANLSLRFLGLEILALEITHDTEAEVDEHGDCVTGYVGFAEPGDEVGLPQRWADE